MPFDQELQSSALRPERAPQTQSHPLSEDLHEVALVEPDRLEGPGVVAQDRRHDIHATPCGPSRTYTHHHATDRGFLPHLEVADRLAVAEVLVAAREVVDEVAHGVEPEGGEPSRHGGRHAPEIRQRNGEDVRAEREARDRRPFRVQAAAEAVRKRRRGHSTIIANAAVPGPMCVPTTAAT